MTVLYPGDVLVMRQRKNVWNTPVTSDSGHIVRVLGPGDTVLVLSSEILCPTSDVFDVVVLVQNVVGYVEFYDHELNDNRKAFDRIRR